MKFLFRLLLFITLFFVSLLYFLPKNLIYNFAEQELLKYKVIISDEIKKEKAFSLEVKNMDIYYDGIKTLNIDKSEFKTFIFSSSVKLENLLISDSFRSMVPSKIKGVYLKHSVLDFGKVNILALGEFGEIFGSYLILENKVFLELKPSKFTKTKYKNLLRQFKIKEGRYYYEYKL